MKNFERLFELAYRDYHSQHRRDRDPVSLVHRYTQSHDQEVAAFFCAILSYGNVATILNSAGRVLEILGPSPYEALIQSERISFGDFKHRFTKGDDLSVLCFWVSRVLREFGSLENFFLRDNSKSTTKDRLSHFVTGLGSPLPKDLQKRFRPQSLKYLLPDPNRGSACKRLNMFLRWVVRPKDGIDLGLWKGMTQSSLLLPVDTHILKTLRTLGWTKSKQATWKVVEEATRQLRKLNPEDPIRYDFSLCHLSMDGRRIEDY